MLKLYVRHGRTWYAKFPGLDGGIVRKSTDVEVGTDRKASRAAALKVAKELMERTLRTAPVIEAKRVQRMTGAPDRPTLGWALEQTWVKTWSRSRSAIVLKHVIRRLQSEVGHWYLDEITHDVIEGYVLKLVRTPANPKGLAPATCNRRTSYIRKAMGDAHRSGVMVKLPTMPKREREKNRKQRYVSPEEETAILDWLTRQTADDHIDKRHEWAYVRDLVVFLIDSGFRFSEVFKMTIEGRFASLINVDVKNQDDTEVRRIPITARAQAAAKAIMASPLYVHTEDPEEVAKLWDWCSQRFDRCTAALGINTKQTRKKERVTIHVLRHTTASRLVQRRVPIYTVQKWMGHKNIATTMRYAHLAPDSFEFALSALEGGPVAVGQSSTGTCAMSSGDESPRSGHSGGPKSMNG